ncbi:hypothetical protein ACFL15_00460 [Patescibacteria group bacterium]
MLYTKEQLLKVQDPNQPTESMLLIKRGETCFGREVSEQYHIVQDWILEQPGVPLGSFYPDLGSALQGVEYMFYAATANSPSEHRNVEQMEIMMNYLNRENLFKGGALRQYPEFQEVIKKAILELPHGQEVINLIQKIDKYKDLFK